MGACCAGQPFINSLATRAAILALAGVGLNLAIGQGGMISVGHAAFFRVGGYAMGILASHAQSYTPLIWLVAALVGGLVAAVIAALSLRVSGDKFVVMTLAVGQTLFYSGFPGRLMAARTGCRIPAQRHSRAQNAGPDPVVRDLLRGLRVVRFSS